MGNDLFGEPVQGVGKMWTTKELAQAGNVSNARVRQLCKDGKLPGAKHFGRDWMIPDNAARYWLEHGRRWKKKKIAR